MKTITINNINLNCPESWEDLTFEKYCQVFYDLDKNEENKDVINIKNEVTIFSRLLDIDEAIILDAPIDFYNKLRDVLSFVYRNDHYNNANNEIAINGVDYKIPTIEEMKLRQHIDLDITTQEPDSPAKFIELLAILIVPVGTEYDGNYHQRMELIKKLPCTKCFPLLAFFLLKEECLREITKLSMKGEQEINHLVQFIQSLSKTSIGNI